jgi:hypothetical protein
MCDPMNPGVVCGAGKHCLPAANHIGTCKGPTGNGGQYAFCNSSNTCAPAFECIQTPFLTTYCMKWCVTDANCGAGDSCYYFVTPVYVGATEYGVCYDGAP